jgi:hypothetical protein
MLKGICYNASRQERRKCSLWHAKSPGGRNSGAFLFRCGKVAYALGWLPLFISVQPFADVVGDYTCQDRE